MVKPRPNQFGSTWTEEKLQILEDYLKAYTTALKDQRFHLTYVDAFAGNGYVSLGRSKPDAGFGPLVEELEELDRGIIQGSARRAIEVDDKPFDSLVFVETNPEYVNQLRSMELEFPNRDIQIEQSDSNDFLRSWCERRSRAFGIPWRGHRAVVFLDPFATQVEWHTIEALATTEAIDLWILFPVSALTRIMSRDREPDENHATILDRVYGGPEWRTLYQTRIRRTLFGDEIETVRADQAAIVDVYLDKVRTAFPYVSDSPKWFYNSCNSPLFAFMFAAANPSRGGEIALRIANYLLNRW